MGGKKAAILISGTSSGVGKTCNTIGLMYAFASRGYIVQPFKCGPDFLDGMHHEEAIRDGQLEYQQKIIKEDQSVNTSTTETERNSTFDSTLSSSKFYDKRNNMNKIRKCVNLDAWMMGSPEAMIQSFHRHSEGADICIIEGCMGLHDSKDGISDDGSTAQTAKLLGGIPVILVIDGSMCGRSVAAMALGYSLFDTHENMRVCGVIVNKVSGAIHTQWIRESIEKEGQKKLRDMKTNKPVSFIGALPTDPNLSIPERYLGLTIPSSSVSPDTPSLYKKLGRIIEEHLDLNKLHKLGQTFDFGISDHLMIPKSTALSTPSKAPRSSPHLCRIGIAQDEAFCFYYLDNLHLLRMSGAELVPFSPINDVKGLPPRLDGIYFGGGYPELYAKQLEKNEKMRKDVLTFSQNGGLIFAECGGFMYLARDIIVSRDDSKPKEMCGVFPLTIRMTPHAKMYYANIEFTSSSLKEENSPSASSFPPPGGFCRGQRYHFSEVFEEDENKEDSSNHQKANGISKPLLVTPLLPGATPEKNGYQFKNTTASYFHLHFSSYINNNSVRNDSRKTMTLADHFIQTACETSPYRKAYAVSFVSAATEIIFALGEESKLSGVTSVCPKEAQYAPRQILCRSCLDIDTSKVSSSDVTRIMQKFKDEKKSEVEKKNGSSGHEVNNEEYHGPPGHWIIDREELKSLKPKIAYVQNTCDLCDAAKDDVLYALRENLDEEAQDKKTDKCLLSSKIEIIKIAPTTLGGMLDAISTIASSLNVKEKGKTLIQSLQARLKRVEAQIQCKLTKQEYRRPKVLSLEGLSPLCVGGHWLPDLKYAAGCIDAFGDKPGCPSRIITWEEILNTDPDILVICPCSATPSRTLNEMHLLASVPEFWKLRCVQSGEVYIFDHTYFSRPGPMLVDAVEMMAVLFHRIVSDHCKIEEGGYIQVTETSKWVGKAFKYQCCTKQAGVSHCTTELSSRFEPCFQEQIQLDDEKDESALTSQLTFCEVTRCTIPNFDLPKNRSAHCIVSVSRRGNRNPSILLFGGESQEAQRLHDVWELHAPRDGWANFCDLHEKERSLKKNPPNKLGNTPTWEKLMCDKIADEDVPTPRSNHAMVACGEHILVFGGWSVDNMTPLSHSEILHSDTLCWTHCSTHTPSEPSPRGNPTLVYRKNTNCVILFGGWNGKRALNDVWSLDMNQWQWEEMPRNTDVNVSWPKPRTDHTSVLWTINEVEDKNKNNIEKTKDIMLVFGGNIEGFGPCSELWGLEFSTKMNHNSETNQKLGATWKHIKVSGPNPPNRTSHAAAIVGKCQKAKMVVVGGTTSELGTGPVSMLCDAWILQLANIIDYKDDTYCKNRGNAWIKLDWSGNGLNRCRHSMTVVNDNSLIWWGGYDGEKAVNDGIGVWRGDLDAYICSDNNIERNDQSMNMVPLQERWNAEIPIRENDLPPEVLEKAKKSSLPGAMYKAIHRHAVSMKKDTYIDPASGYSVFTSTYLKKRPCCGNGCRHCPHGHKNVPGRKENRKLCKDDNLDW